MRHRSVALAGLFLCLTGLRAQNSEPSGVTAEWDVRAQMAAMAADVKKLEPLLKYVEPGKWIEQGAPDAYVRQLQSANNSVAAVIRATSLLAEKPENLPLALDAFFELERTGMLLDSLRAGVRKYQGNDLAGMIEQAFSANSLHRDRLRQHVRDLARLQHEEYQIASEEAQRCRGFLTKQPLPEKKSGKNQNR